MKGVKGNIRNIALQDHLSLYQCSRGRLACLQAFGQTFSNIDLYVKLLNIPHKAGKTFKMCMHVGAGDIEMKEQPGERRGLSLRPAYWTPTSPRENVNRYCLQPDAVGKVWVCNE